MSDFDAIAERAFELALDAGFTPQDLAFYPAVADDYYCQALYESKGIN